MKTVLLAYYPLKVRYNYGIILLSAILNRVDIKTFILQLNDLTEIEKVIRETKADYIGFGLVTGKEYDYCLPFMREAKETGIPVMVGGIYVRRGSYIDPKAVDYICRGEGEILEDFILNGETDVFDKPYLHKDITNLPLPNYNHLTGFEFDRDIPFLKGIKILPYHSSRGCPYQCSFCEVRFQPKKIRIKTTIKEDLNYIQNTYKPTLIHIMDELVPYYDNGWCSQIEDTGINFMAYIRADISQEKLEFLMKNGLRVAIFGVESGDEKYRNEILKKDLYDEDIYRTTAILKINNIPYIPFYMLGGPYETDEIRGKTIGMARGLGGFPVVWQYEDLSKRVFNIKEEKIEKYAKKLSGSTSIIKNNINDTSNYVYSEEEGFIVYQMLKDTMFIKEFSGKGKRWQDKIEELCREYGGHRYLGQMKKEYRGFQKKYDLECFGNLIGRDI